MTIERIWDCKIGGQLPQALSDGVDLPMRQAIQKAYKEITGVEAEFTFSGWDGTLNETERDIVRADRAGAALGQDE